MNYITAKELITDIIDSMKRLTTLIVLLLITYNIAWAQTDTISQEARATYDAAQFNKTIEILEKERESQLANNLESSDLYYNLGNAYYKVGNLAQARLNYERATLLNPGDKDAKANIQFIKTKLEDKIPVADTFFIGIWFRAIQNWFGSNGWATIAVIFFILLIASLSLFFLSSKEQMKKISFYCGIVFIVLIIFANVFSYRQKKQIEVRDSAIVISESAPMRSAPDSNSTELFVLHAGTKVKITKEDRYWLEVELENGNVGWIQRNNIDII